MKTIELPTKRFDMHGFLDEILDFLRGLTKHDILPDAMVSTVHEDGEAEWPDPADPKSCRNVISEGKTVFLSFHERYAGDSIRCAGGRTITVPDAEDEHGNPNPEWDERYESIPEETASFGYVLTVADGAIRIESAILTDGATFAHPAGIERVDDCGALDEPMAEFAAKFDREAGRE